MRSLQIFKVWGVPFKLHTYWFVILFVFTWSITNEVNLTSKQTFNMQEALIIGFSTSFLLLSLIILYEICHTFVLLNHGVKIKNITFYFLGPILQIEKDCQNALGNIKIAIVRPLLYFSTALILSLISSGAESEDQILLNIFSKLAALNLFLGFLNLIPIGSLDGGTLFKSIIWYFSGSRNKGRDILNKLTLLLSTLVFLLGIISIFSFSFYYGFLLFILGIFGINSSKSESQFLKIEHILKVTKISELKLRPLRKIESIANFIKLNNLTKDKIDKKDKYLFLTNNGRWDGFISEDILKSVSIKKWSSALVGDYSRPINSFNIIYINTELWKTIEKIETTKEGILLVVSPSGIPIGIIDRKKIGQFVLNKLGLNLPKDIIGKLSGIENYPLGLELPRIVKLMKKKGDI